MKDVSHHRLRPGFWAIMGSLLGFGFGLHCCLDDHVRSTMPPGTRGEVLFLGLFVAPPLLGGAVDIVLALINNSRAPDEQSTQLPAGVDEAARERFNAPRPRESEEGAGGPDERVAPDREGLMGAD
jgi:hypothetical protein